MAYVINKFSGEQLVVLQDGTLDTSTSLNLVGRNYVGYGESQNENFVFLLENFANDAPPARPIAGQIWFNTSDATAYAYDGSQWNPIGSATVSATTPQNNNAGALWLKTPVNQLYVYTGSEWRFIGPESVEGFGSTRARAGSLDDLSGNPQPVIFLETNGVPFAICTHQNFNINPSNSVPGFANLLQVGINLSSTAKINGSITGNAVTADQFSTARLINGVPFNGTMDVTVKASTTNFLRKGSYIVGSDFDGGTERTWSVDATSSNSIGKVVARNSEGGFSAGTITADFLGNLTGNVTASTGTSSFNIVQANQFIGAQLQGNAATATRLATARSINGINFDGTQNITVTASAGTLTGNEINADVKLSSLEQLGTLTNLNVANDGILIGSGSQFRLFVDSSVPTLRSTTGTLNFDMGSSGPDVSFVNAARSLSLGGPNAPAIIGDNTTNLGITGYKFDGVYANNFYGNASTATLATTATNVVGGGAGSIPFQTSSGTTSMLGLGTPGYVLKAQAGTIGWEALNTEQLNKGSYVNMINTTTSGTVSFFNSSVPVTISVDATSTNTAGKVVARDGSGNFAAGTITANLIGNVTGLASNNVAKTGDTMSGFLTLHANPVTSLHAATKSYVDSAISNIQSYDDFTNGTQSPRPNTFPSRSIRGFSAYNSTDFPGLYYGGITVSGPGGVYSGQLAFNWNSEEAAPTGLYFRVNDDTSTTNAWSAWRQIATTDITETYTYGNTVYSTSGFTNQVGSWNNGANFFDVFPPGGKTMGNLVAFIPSIAVIHYAGGVNGDDSMRCTWSNLGDRIRVYVQNTEQRSTPAANYLAIWR
jgi:hypothetical protein